MAEQSEMYIVRLMRNIAVSVVIAFLVAAITVLTFVFPRVSEIRDNLIASANDQTREIVELHEKMNRRELAHTDAIAQLRVELGEVRTNTGVAQSSQAGLNSRVSEIERRYGDVEQSIVLNIKDALIAHLQDVDERFSMIVEERIDRRLEHTEREIERWSEHAEILDANAKKLDETLRAALNSRERGLIFDPQANFVSSIKSVTQSGVRLDIERTRNTSAKVPAPKVIRQRGDVEPTVQVTRESVRGDPRLFYLDIDVELRKRFAA